jgi:hypothetical protein
MPGVQHSMQTGNGKGRCAHKDYVQHPLLCNSAVIRELRVRERRRALVVASKDLQVT